MYQEDNDRLRLGHLVVPESVTGALLPGWLCIHPRGKRLGWQAYWEGNAVLGEGLLSKQIMYV